MPHLIVEFAHDLADADHILSLIDAVHQAALMTGLFKESHIKTRAIPIENYRTGAGHEPFVHAQLRIKSGRTAEQKTNLSRAVLAAICEQKLPAAVVTVEVVDIDRASYAKYAL